MILHSTTRLDSKDEPPKYKVRKNWFQAVGMTLSRGIRDHYLPNEFLETYHLFHKRNRDIGFHYRDTKKEDIDYANNLLDSIIAELSSNG